MINHARTLLANMPAGDYHAWPGEELIPADFSPVSLDNATAGVRQALMGKTPDRLMINYRCHQLLTMLHATELGNQILALDSRISYDLLEDDRLFRHPFALSARQRDGELVSISLYPGEAPPPDFTGRCRYEWEATRVDTDTLRIRQVVPGLVEEDREWDNNSNRNGPFVLPGVEASFSVDESQYNRAVTWDPSVSAWHRRATGYWVDNTETYSAVGDNYVWDLRLDLRPTASLGDLRARVLGLGESVIHPVFHHGETIGREQPWSTFWELWNEHPDEPYRLGGLVAAWIFRVNELRATQ